MKKLYLLMSVLLTGCASIYNVHREYDPSSGKLMTEDKNGAKGLITVNSIAQVSTLTTNKNYGHTFNGKDLKSQGDTDMMKTVIESTGTAIGNAGHTTVTGKP